MVGRAIHIFDHRAAAVVENPENIHNPFSSQPTTEAQHKDPAYCPRPQFWVETSEIPWPAGLGWALAFRDIARATDARTVIAAAVPFAAFGHKLPLLPQEPRQGGAPLLLANLNALPLDYIARQKVQSTHLNFYIVEQLPILPLDAFARRIGATTAEAMIRDHVLRLSYTAHDLKPFAEDLGHHGPPFAWDAEERLHLRARLDALFFLLYGLDRDAADYILDTFPILREEEEKRFAGRFRSRDLILGYMAAFSAGDAESRIAG